MSQNQQVVPDGLQELIKAGISTAFPASSNAAGCINVTPSKMDNIDYQFHIRGLASCLRKDPNDIIVQIRETIPDNDIIERLETSENGSYANIFTKIKRPKPCKTCSNNTTLGRQSFSSQTAEQNLRDKLIEELSRRMLKTQLLSKPRRDTTIAEKVLENFELILGGGQVIDDLIKAVESVGNRDYPQLNLEKIPTIFVPNIFLTKHPEVLDYTLYVQQLQELKETIDEIEARKLKKDQRTRDLTEEELELVEQLKKVDNLKHIIGEHAEKQVYNFLKTCIEDEEAVVINNFKIMNLKDLDDIAEDFEKDFVILNLTRRFIMTLEVKANCNEDSLRSAKNQTNACKRLISKWVEGVLTEENGWSFYSAVHYQNKPENYSFCDKCSKFVIFGEEFLQKFPDIMTEMPVPPSWTEESARAEFKKLAKLLLFLASYEPVVTPARITDKLVKIIDKSGNLENIAFWNNLYFCWTPKQLSLIRTETLKKVLLLSQPSSGKTFILKAKARKLALNGQKVLFLLPCYKNIQSLLFFQLQQEFEEFSDSITVDNVKANVALCIDGNDLMEKLEKYNDHHIIMDEVAVGALNDIAVIKKAAQKCKSKTFWMTVTFIYKQEDEKELRSELIDFYIFKDELSIPLRNTTSIVLTAYNIKKGNRN